MANAADNLAGAVGGREVLAFDLYGTLVDPIAISSELSQLLGDRDGLEVARLWRLKQLEYFAGGGMRLPCDLPRA